MKETIQLANSQQGWVRLNRSILETPVMKNSKLFHIYGWCLLRANHKSKWVSLQIRGGNREVEVKAGQFIMGRKKAADTLGMPESTFYSNIKKLQGYGFITIESNNQYSIVTLSNTVSYKAIESTTEQRKNDDPSNRGISDQQPDNTNKNEEEKNKKNKINNENSFAVSTKSQEKSCNIKASLNDPIIEWSFKKLKKYIVNHCPDISRLPYQITISEFQALMKLYDWTDIRKKIEDLEAWDGLADQNRVYKILRSFLNRDQEVKQISGISANSASEEWDEFQRRQAHLKEEKRIRNVLKKKRKQRDAFFNNIKDAELWEEEYSNYDESERKEIVENYFFFIDEIDSLDSLSNQFGESPLILEEYLNFRILYTNDEALLRFLSDFKQWDRINPDISFYENFGEYLLEKSDQPDPGDY